MSLAEPNCCPIYISRMMLFAECVSAKLLPDLCQPHDVARRAKPLPDLRQPHNVVRRVRLSQTVARSTSAA